VDKAPDAFRTISEVAEELNLPQHVLRFWETRFTQIKPMKRGGGRRYYRPEDVDLLRGIRHLLYGEGYTIRGVQRILREHGAKLVQTVWQAGAAQPPRHPADEEDEAAHVEATHAETQDGERPRGLFGILPSRNREPEPEDEEEDPADDAEGRREPRLDSPAVVPSREPVVAAAKIDRDDFRKLQAALFELGECRRLLDVALQDET
jgi:DNA-binding transcriptional MerR regulator